MSKRLKAAHYSSKGAPRWSFQSLQSRGLVAPSSSARAMTASPTTATATPVEESSTTSSHTKILSDLNEFDRNSILVFASAVEVQLSRLQTAPPRRIPLHVCYDLMGRTPELSLPILPKNELEWKNEKEMFLYKFLCATTTAQLYDIHCEEGSSSLGPDSSSSRWYLRQCTPQEGGRKTLDDVRAVLFDQSRPISPRSNQQLRLAVRSLRPKVKRTKRPLLLTMGADAKPPAKTEEGTTVEERVRAKHEARRLREEEEATRIEKHGASGDETWRLRVADMLWHRSRQVWHRHEKFASPRRKGTSSPCSFVLGDVVRHVSQQSGVMGTKLTRRQIVESLQELCRQVPEWIRRSAAKQDTSTVWDRSDTLWIQPLDYKEVRLRLLGKASTSTVAKAPWKLLGLSDEPPRVEDAAEASSMATKKRDRPKNSDPCTKRELWKDAPFRDRSSPPESKKVRRDTGSLGEKSASPASPPKKRLRVNPHLIISDADYQGGDIIIPSRKDSPRGLKNLFRQLNSGKRI